MTPNDSDLSVDLTGTSAVVVGASGGIGAAIALRLARSGSRVTATARGRDALAPLASIARDEELDVRIDTVDVTSESAVNQLVERTLGEVGCPTILVNCAGAASTKAALDLSIEEWDLIQATQVRGTFLTCQKFGAPMVGVGYGKIINLSSTWAFTVRANRSAYCAAKAGVSHLTSALAVEWAGYGIRVNAIAPGATMTAAAQERIGAEPGRAEQLTDQIPLGSLATVDDVADTALFLSSRASDFITGETIMVDGGWRTAR